MRFLSAPVSILAQRVTFIPSCLLAMRGMTVGSQVTLNNQGEMRIRDMPDQDTLGRSQGKNLTNRMPWLHMMGGDGKSEEDVVDRRSELVHDVPISSLVRVDDLDSLVACSSSSAF